MHNCSYHAIGTHFGTQNGWYFHCDLRLLGGALLIRSIAALLLVFNAFPFIILMPRCNAFSPLRSQLFSSPALVLCIF